MLKPVPFPPIPPETKRLGERLYPPENVYRQIGDLFADVVCDEQFAEMYSNLGQPALSPTLLSLVCLLQFMEHLSDRQTLVMVQSRLDWKYALHLELDASGFDPSVLSEFRARLERNGKQRVLFDAILERCKQEGLLRGRHLQRTDSVMILSGVRQLNRLELVIETMRLALEAIAEADAEWVRERIPDEWVMVYGEWAQAERVVKETGEKGAARVRAMLVSVGEDGYRLLEWLDENPGPRWEREPEAVGCLRRVWAQQYRVGSEEQVEVSTKQTRKADGVDGELITTPHDEEVRYRAKGGGEEGYKLHVTETADEQELRLILDVEVTKLTEYEAASLERIQQRLREGEMAPEQHLVDSGYVDGTTMEQSEQRGIELVGRLQPQTEPRTGGEGEGRERFRVEDFELDFERQEARCPAGKVSVAWHNTERTDKTGAGRREHSIRWSQPVCQACPFKKRCLSAKATRRVLKLHGNAERMQQHRAWQQTDAFKQIYRRRSGVEASVSMLIRSNGGRRARYRGSGKTLVQFAMVASAMNLKRIAASRAETRVVRSRASRLRRLLGESEATALGWGQNLKERASAVSAA